MGISRFHSTTTTDNIQKRHRNVNGILTIGYYYIYQLIHKIFHKMIKFFLRCTFFTFLFLDIYRINCYSQINYWIVRINPYIFTTSSNIYTKSLYMCIFIIYVYMYMILMSNNLISFTSIKRILKCRNSLCINSILFYFFFYCI